MSSLDTLENIQQAMKGRLPGKKAHKKMVPERVGHWDPPDDHREAAVLLLLYPRHSTNQTELYLPLIRRPQYPGVHGGQIALPGGQREPEETLQRTALRETEEEIGIPTELIQVIGSLTPLYVPPSNFHIQPFVALGPSQPQFKPDPKEVAEVIELSLSTLLDPTIIKEETRNIPGFGRQRVPFFDIGHKVWGATAMILSEFLTLLIKKRQPSQQNNYG